MAARIDEPPQNMFEDRLSVFAHLQAEKCRLYRAILSVFRVERERFMIALRPADVHQALGTVPRVDEKEREVIENHLLGEVVLELQKLMLEADLEGQGRGRAR